MCQIDEHAQAVHFGDDLLTELGQSIVLEQRGIHSVHSILIRPVRNRRMTKLSIEYGENAYQGVLQLCVSVMYRTPI